MAGAPRTVFPRSDWARLGFPEPAPVDAEELGRLRGRNEPVGLAEVAEVYRPLAQLVELQYSAVRDRRAATASFLGQPKPPRPFVLGLAGSVAAGKSTTARILQALLARPRTDPGGVVPTRDHAGGVVPTRTDAGEIAPPRDHAGGVVPTRTDAVEIVATDGFLLPNRVLQQRKLFQRKGFPESYDRKALIRFLLELRSGESEVLAPVYDHISYDVLSGELQVLRSPEIVIVEGLNLLQPPVRRRDGGLFVSDLLDFTVYVDAAEGDLRRWYVERFLGLRSSAFADPRSYFTRYAELSDAEAVATAQHIWDTVNALNLRENILPTRERADVLLRKGPAHAIDAVSIRG